MTSPFFDTMPRIVGHRGACGLAPENTMASFAKAAELDTSCIEIDVMLTQDNEPVICHDMNVRRCTNGEGPVLLKSLAEIKALDAGSWFSKEFQGQTIPTLKEALSFLSDNNMSLNLEIKPTDGWQVPTAKTVCAALEKLNFIDIPILISSFNEEALEVVANINSDIPLGYLTEAVPMDWEKRLKRLNASSFHCHRAFVTKNAVKDIQSAGYKFLVYTVNDPEEAKKLLDWGVDAIITDYPDRMKAVA